jgi:hypothetical protein
VAINKSYYFIVGKDAMGCKIKKRKADPPFSKAGSTYVQPTVKRGNGPTKCFWAIRYP